MPYTDAFTDYLATLASEETYNPEGCWYCGSTCHSSTMCSLVACDEEE